MSVLLHTEMGPTASLLNGAERGGLDVVLARPAWHRDALCREHPKLNWVPAPGESIRAQRAICSRCSVAGECAEAGTNESAGVWAGSIAEYVEEELLDAPVKVRRTVRPIVYRPIAQRPAGRGQTRRAEVLALRELHPDWTRKQIGNTLGITGRLVTEALLRR